MDAPGGSEMTAQGRALAGRHVIVAGASRGIGAAIAVMLAGRGCVLTLLGRDRERLEGVVRSAHAAGATSCRMFAVDLTDDAAVSVLAKQWEESPVPYGLVNCAGAADSSPFLATGDDVWRRMLDVNLMTAVHCTRAVLPALLRAGDGRIVNVASTAGLTGYRYVSAYTAAKHAVVGLTRSLAVEVARGGITVNAVCPGYTDTEMLNESAVRVSARTGKGVAEVRAAYAAANPQGRLITPGEVARTVVWLCEPAQSAVTGQTITVDGVSMLQGEHGHES
ncbi:MAG TPA: SDR family oxidoreductase [Candidatus Krumholzibacteria bacterium]|nr:SDR family oxidoreductase [Candidatus Krumholzibacteria bacterium]